MCSLRTFEELCLLRFNHEELQTKTSNEQIEAERKVLCAYEAFHLQFQLDKKVLKLNRRDHCNYIKESLNFLSQDYECLDASRTWLCYWSVHSLSLLQALDSKCELDNIVGFLKRCQHVDGGFGGGPGQYPHLATTYAAVNALCIIGTIEAYNIINRKGLRDFLWSLRSMHGSFCMHRNGEEDIRGVYCALAIASLTNVGCSSLFNGTAEWVVSCQTYEGGFSGCPSMEAHGGYTFCGLASLFLLNKTHLCDTSSLLRWMANRQMKLEGGFQGRTNKLVDGCYSFWQTSAFALAHQLLMKEDMPPEMFMFNNAALQEYVLICCQAKRGGLVDKPGKHPDLYHTCYTLSGLSVAQTTLEGTSSVLGSEINKLQKTHFIYNIDMLSVTKAKRYFKIHVDDDQTNIPIEEI